MSGYEKDPLAEGSGDESVFADVTPDAPPKRTRVTGARKAARDAEIRRRRDEGQFLHQIAQEMGLTRPAVYEVLKQAELGMSKDERDSEAYRMAHAEAIRAGRHAGPSSTAERDENIARLAFRRKGAPWSNGLLAQKYRMKRGRIATIVCQQKKRLTAAGEIVVRRPSKKHR
jgi:predicted transcriptional regulator